MYLREIDDMGRVVIPNEVRKVLKLEEGTPMELHVQADTKELLLKRSRREDGQQTT